MKLILLVVFAFATVLALSVLNEKTKRRKGPLTDDAPYRKKPTLLNTAEQDLFHNLRNALPDHHVMAQVRLADLIDIDANGATFQKWFNYISSKSVDFVVCDEQFRVLACIELDGPQHARETRKKADQQKDFALKAAGHKIVRWRTDSPPTVETIKATILENEHRTTPQR